MIFSISRFCYCLYIAAALFYLLFLKSWVVFVIWRVFCVLKIWIYAINTWWWVCARIVCFFVCAESIWAVGVCSLFFTFSRRVTELKTIFAFKRQWDISANSYIFEANVSISEGILIEVHVIIITPVCFHLQRQFVS